MKIVIVSLYFYPKLGPRPHRTTALANEFARRGHEVVVYALLGDYDYSEYSQKTGIRFECLGKSKFGLADSKIKFNIFQRAFTKFIGKKYFAFPQIELMGMVAKVLKKEGNIDYLISIAYPHSIHWGIARYMKKAPNQKNFWVADCGDPFMGNPFRKPPFYFERLERGWCELCSYISIPVKEAKNAYYPEYRNKIKVIPQGFDFNIKISNYKPNKIPTFAYSGTVYKNLRDPSAFLEFLSNQNCDFKFIVYTRSLHLFNAYYDKLKDKLEIRDYVNRDKLLLELSKMDFLINIENKSNVQVPSKLIDYALTQRPILNITSEFNEKDFFEQFISGNYTNQLKINNINNFNIKNVVNKFLFLRKENIQKTP